MALLWQYTVLLWSLVRGHLVSVLLYDYSIQQVIGSVFKGIGFRVLALFMNSS